MRTEAPTRDSGGLGRRKLGRYPTRLSSRYPVRPKRAQDRGALRRLEEGTFGYCFECGEEISERRLRALPFAVRCKDCEEARETAQQRERAIAQRRGAASLFIDMQG